ncbi:hypothetical protein SAMN05443377_12324 [Propionibacterium cyclohexanicum]|uniref:Uncharacterized protein n=1 Tax=Propionibacterium cyclohexanicum TaxID=64702 RepID=A0A1H9THL4_9ACTN|nr:hypothetical protein [Propionibacterium cyclohexanicum]SER96641.1 hypothetical protein SAMN05443377_12324 [Propionibacterium cyclohexanicum]
MPIDPDDQAQPAGLLAWPDAAADGFDTAALRGLAAAVDARVDCADHRLLLLLKNWFECSEQLEPALRAALHASITGFRYSIEEPGADSMCSWTESHLLAFATCEYLAGQLFPDNLFTNDGAPGGLHRRRGELRIRQWLDDRFRWGFSEWLSDSEYVVDIAALTLLADYSRDDDLTRRASILLDMLMLDMALHRFDGHFASAAARSSAHCLLRLSSAPSQAVVDAAFAGKSPQVDARELSAIFLCRHHYTVPAALVDIAGSEEVFRITGSQGLDIDEVAAALAHDPLHPRSSPDEQLDYWWSMEALTAPAVLKATVSRFARCGLETNGRLAHLGELARIPWPLRRTALTVANPVTVGAAVQRGNIQTFRTPSYLLSSVQRYHPGEFGGRHHLWQACLPGGISVFGNQPAGSRMNQSDQPQEASEWVGNGLNPDIAQSDDVLLVQYDLRGRQGRFEGARRLYSHIYFPFVDFDETRMGIHWVAGRRGGSYIGILSTAPLDLVSETEIVQRGVRIGYAVICADEWEFGSLMGFVQRLKEYWISLDNGFLRLATAYGIYELEWGGDFLVNRKKVDTDYPRYSSHVVEAPRYPRALRVESARNRLVLDWTAGTRKQTLRPGD